MSETAADSRRDASPISWRWPAGVFAAATIVILTVAWPHIAASSYEIGDSAANSPVASRFALALLTALALWQGTKAVARGGYEGDPKLPDFYAKLTALGPRIALHPDVAGDAQGLWLRIVGLEVYGLRRGEKPFCVAENWAFAYGPDYRCSPADLAGARAIWITGHSTAPGAPPLAQYQNFTMFDRVPPYAGAAP